ncbi:hypothetical protein A3Q56_05273 [Intoshia linei]|uniref:Iron-sulfur cluster assembly 2 homolog, mitochondrial n=1 Tax=Intoshia linei TaxID=1819745 RepID=A0A177AZU8_9BILA|nr:hypothetical protein A3Q56_05273 [Intoshia linei]
MMAYPLFNLVQPNSNIPENDTELPPFVESDHVNADKNPPKMKQIVVTDCLDRFSSCHMNQSHCKANTNGGCFENSKSKLEYIYSFDKKEQLTCKQLYEGGHCTSDLKLASLGKNKMLRILVDTGGCSGYTYNFTIDTNIEKDDILFDENGLKLIIDKISIEFIKGSTIEYASELIRSSFVVLNNPNSQLACSCGVSFSPKI